MAWQSNQPLFRSLTNEEEQQFREHARIEPPGDLSKWRIYHPVCRDEWVNPQLGGNLKVPLPTHCAQSNATAQGNLLWGAVSSLPRF
jgi:hypothetical protein